MSLRRRRSPQRKAYDRRLDRALTQYRASKAERSWARALFGRLVVCDDPMPYAKALSHVLEQLRDDRRAAAQGQADRPVEGA
jgi:hypothetical protein